MHWRRKWQPTPVFLPGESQGRGSLVGCRLWGRRVGHDCRDLAAAAAAAANHHLNLQQVTIILLVEGLKYCENYQNVTQRHKMNQRCWKTGTDGLA